jgi:UDP-N-acetylmuramoylalanine--D-glutamate ligase
VLWIGGGRSKGGDLRAFASRIAPHLRQAYLIGETAAEMAEHLRAQAVPVSVCPSLRDAVARAHAAAAAGDAVLLSPGFASFDMFQGYDDRGRQFEALVAELQPVSPKRLSPHKPKSSNRSVVPGLCLP